MWSGRRFPPGWRGRLARARSRISASRRRPVSRIVDAAAVGLAAFFAGASLLGLAGRFAENLDLLTHFAPIWLAGDVVALVIGLTRPDPSGRRLALLLGTVGALASGALLAPEFLQTGSPLAPGDSPGQIKLIQFNTWDRNVDPAATVAWIERQRPDFVVMEELLPFARKALLADGFHLTSGTGHVAIFSRAMPDPFPIQFSLQEWRVLPPIARAVFGQGRERFTLIGVHPAWPTGNGALAGRRALASALGRCDRSRLIVAGDFNLTPWSFALKDLGQGLGLERRDRGVFTWPARQFLGGRAYRLAPVMPLDHIFAGSAWRTVSLSRGPALGSEHYPLIAVLALSPATSDPHGPC